MMNFRKRVTKSGKITSGKKVLPWQQRKQYKGCMNKKLFERPSDAYQIRAVTSCSTHKIDQQETDG